VFEPVFAFSFDRQTILDDERIEDVNRFRGATQRTTVLCGQGSASGPPPVCTNVQPLNVPVQLDLIDLDVGPIAAIVYNGPRPAGRRPAREVAHEAPIDEERKTNTFTLNLG
jgi:hypothetical protein